MVITLDWGAVIFFSQFCSLGLNSYKRLFATIFSATQRCNIASTSQRCVALKIVVANLPAKHHLYARKLEVNSFSLYALLGAAETRQCDYRDGFKVSNSFHDCEQPHKTQKYKSSIPWSFVLVQFYNQTLKSPWRGKDHLIVLLENWGRYMLLRRRRRRSKPSV